MQVSLVDGLPAAGADTDVVKTIAVQSNQGEGAAGSAALTSPHGPQPSMPDLNLVLAAPNSPILPVAADTPGATASAAEAKDVSRETVEMASTATATSASAGGDPLDTSAMLAQIARCLPPSLRPALGFSTLVLEIGEDGALTAAPAISSLVATMTAGEAAAADRVVQAALQCGPYPQANFKKTVISLVPDFSSIQSTVVTASTLHGPPGGRTARN